MSTLSALLIPWVPLTATSSGSRASHLQFPEEVQACSGHYLLGVQVQGQHKDRDYDGHYHLQRHLGYMLWAAGVREIAWQLGRR